MYVFVCVCVFVWVNVCVFVVVFVHTCLRVLVSVCEGGVSCVRAFVCSFVCVPPMPLPSCLQLQTKAHAAA